MLWESKSQNLNCHLRIRTPKVSRIHVTFIDSSSPDWKKIWEFESWKSHLGIWTPIWESKHQKFCLMRIQLKALDRLFFNFNATHTGRFALLFLGRFFDWSKPGIELVLFENDYFLCLKNDAIKIRSQIHTALNNARYAVLDAMKLLAMVIPLAAW